MTTTKDTGPRPACAAKCGRQSKYGRLGWCDACYFRWWRAGKPDTGPPPPINRKEAAAARREECLWLVDGGESVERAAERIGVTLDTVRRYVRLPGPCIVRECTETATYRRRCDTHRDLRSAYRNLRAAGSSRNEAAAILRVDWRDTYQWEPGAPGRGRPRREKAPRP